jgi:hypothetical protein
VVIWIGIDGELVVVLMKKRKGGSRWSAAGIPLGGEALSSSCQSQKEKEIKQKEIIN